MRRLLQFLFVLSHTAAAFSEGVVLLQTHASIVNSDVGVARSADVVIKSINDERKSFARRVMDRQGDMAGVKRVYRTYEPVSGPNGDIRMQADAPAFRKEQQQRPNIFFVHNNKCGGSEICYMAQVNGERSPVSPDAWGCEAPHKAGEKIDEARIDMATFVETQGIYPEELEEMKAANDTILMTILRDPVTRVVSEWRHYGYRWDPKLHDTSLREDWTELDPLKDDMDAMLDYHSTHDPDELSWSVGGANLTEAIKALHAYDLVLITEDLDSTDFARLKTIGWTSQDVVHEDHQNAAEPLVVAKAAGIAALKFALSHGVSSKAEAEQIGEDAVEAAGGSPVSDRASVYKYLGPDRVKRIEELFAADVSLYRAGVEIAKEQRRVQLPCSIDSSCR